ncbi:hypothetical protein KP509_07G043800 [Ceratopteris richardii]|uniref:TF-B3 domain-containing protein n=1 Tax=Ceratopteris richardii TaxID=49495 RepID=A0A8T2UKM0_CERRI|nr:hypothetical protein KP509_07G043800 [Ceratopteris richardii]
MILVQGLPLKFCKKHLPRDDGTMILEDENGEEWESVYLAHRTGLSGGWRGFAIDHHLEDGDAIIFELIKPTRFKVHIIRVSEVMSEDDNKENAMGLKAGQKRKSLEKKNRKDDNKENAMKLKAGQKRKSLEKKNRKDDNKENAMQPKAGQKRKSFEKKKSGEELKTGSKTAQKEGKTHPLAKKRKNRKELAATNKSRGNLKSVNRK